MKIKKHKKTNTIELLKCITDMSKLDDRIYKITNTALKYKGLIKSSWFLDYDSTLQIVHLEMVGLDHKKVYDKFGTCTGKKPTAWYTSRYNTKEDSSIKGPRNFTGFIPDCIENVIHSSKIKPDKKYRLLIRMFKDLIKQEKKYER